jgi:hypothetical protein
VAPSFAHLKRPVSPTITTPQDGSCPKRSLLSRSFKMGMDLSVELHKDLDLCNRFAGQVWSTREPKAGQSVPSPLQLSSDLQSKGASSSERYISQICHLVCTLTVVERVLHRRKQTLGEQVRPSGDPFNCKFQIKSTCGEEVTPTRKSKNAQEVKC